MGRKDENSETVAAAIAVLSETFSPASSLEDTARKYTTEQIAQAIYEITGRRPAPEIVYEVMQQEGYRYVVDDTSSSMRYVWLLKYKC